MGLRFLKGALLGALLAAAPPVRAQPPVREVVERFDAAQAKVSTLQAPFSLTIRRALLRTPTVTKGTLWLQESDYAHFTFAPPEDLVIHITPKALVSYSPGEGAAEVMKIGIIKNANRKFLGLGQRLSYLSDYFRISVVDAKDPANTWLLVLEPRSSSVRKRLQLLQIWVDRDSWLPRQMNWVERSGDSWLLELGTLALNGPVPPAVSGFKVPPGTPTRDTFSFFATRRK